MLSILCMHIFSIYEIKPIKGSFRPHPSIIQKKSLKVKLDRSLRKRVGHSTFLDIKIQGKEKDFGDYSTALVIMDILFLECSVNGLIT